MAARGHPARGGQRARSRQPARGAVARAGAWSAAWCAQLERLGDFEGRRERGREYMGEGAVLGVDIERGRISARVQGSRVYQATIVVTPLPEAWHAALRQLARAVGRPVREVLRGRLPAEVVEAMTSPRCGVLPGLGELAMVCTCPDRTRPCKHIFAGLYAVAPRFDEDPALLLQLRGVELEELSGETDPEALPIQPGTLAALCGSGGKRRPADRNVTPRRAAAKVVRARSSTPWVLRAELRALGVPVRTIDAWLRGEVLLRTEQRGVYRRTPAADRELAPYFSG